MTTTLRNLHMRDILHYGDDGIDSKELNDIYFHECYRIKQTNILRLDNVQTSNKAFRPFLWIIRIYFVLTSKVRLSDGSKITEKDDRTYW